MRDRANPQRRGRVHDCMRMLAPILCLIAAACAVPDSGAPGRSSHLPPGARIEPSGYATILKAPPVPFSVPHTRPSGWEAPLPRGEKRLPTDDVEILQHRWERSTSLEQARAEVMQVRSDAAEAQTLAARLNAAEPHNFVRMRLRHAPRRAWAFAFKRDPEGTLRRHSSNARFLAEHAPFTDAELEALRSTWMPRLAPHVTTASTDIESGQMIFGMALSEDEFRAMPKFRNFAAPPGLRLEFPEEPGLPRITPDAEPFVRIFPLRRDFPGIILTGGSLGRIVLRDGCLFLGDRLVRLNRTMGLFRDPQGYLALRDRADPARPYARIGEDMVWSGPSSAPVDDETRAALRHHCGDYPLADIHSPTSARAWRRRAGIR